MAESRDETSLARQLTSLVSLKVPSSNGGRSIFSKEPKNVEVSLIDIDTYTKGPAEPFIIRNEEQLREYIKTRPEHQARIISICCKNSITPLLITQSAMQTLLDRYDIGVDFLDLVHSFGRKPRISDAGHGRMTIHRRRNGAYDIQYLLPYVESYGVDETKYTDRWVGVFNRFSLERAGQNLSIILHPMQNSEAQQRIESATKHALDFCNNPSLLHLVILSTYIGNWRLCIQSIGEKIEEKTGVVMVSKFTDETNHYKALGWLVELSVQREKLLPLKPKLKVVHQILARLKEINSFVNTQPGRPNHDREQTDDLLESYLQRVEGHLQSVEALEHKLQGTLNLLEAAVDLGNRNSTGKIDKRMLQLASHSADDSAAMRVITFLTMLYLPPSFVSTFLGMDLFKFDNENAPSGVLISKGFWLFCILCIPLSAGTFLSWKVFWKRHRRKRRPSDLHQSKDIELGLM